ncbi:conserved hypothetical protein [uncultured Desulfobacterium sp.]|uniref:DUF3786 domain-containing protein n=1 Tax=uncultured Desulfobacterium sp. TaxID=201089 RepID=A0A445N2D5_9BACT|nr:conserved hypothetical protein [uncultured Desulfobacterium sp.]
MTKNAAIFEKTYKNYLSQVSALNVKSVAEKLGVQIFGSDIEIPFFNSNYRVSVDGITGPTGKEPVIEVCVVLCRYLIMASEDKKDEMGWDAFRDFKNAGPLNVYFAKEVERLITNRFSGNIKALEEACGRLGGSTPDAVFPYDFSMQFRVLPKLSILLLFNDADEEFSANASVLFQKGADSYLDAECLAIVGSIFAGYLLKR